MKKKLYRSMWVIACGTILLTTVVSLLLSYGLIEAQIKETIRNECYLVAAGLNDTADEKAYFEELAKPLPETGRLSVVAADGTVLYDSVADAANMENHADREEIQEALESGEGTAQRRSFTLGQSTYYCAVRLKNGNVIRVGYYAESFFSMFFSILPAVLLLMLLVIAVSLILSRRVTEQIVKPVTEAADRLDLAGTESPYEELMPFFQKIRAQHEEITAHMETIRADQKTLRLIIENMSEGLILLAADQRILMHNHSAEELLNAPDCGYIGQPFVALARSAALNDAVKEALSGQSSAVNIENRDRMIRCYVSPVTDHGALNGVLLFLLDETAQYRAEQIRSEFSANVSHELKTPLTSISGFAELLKNKMVGEEQMPAFAQTIYDEAQRLLTLIGDIMRLSRIEEQGTKPSDRVNLLTMAKGVCASLKKEAASHQVTVSCTGSDQIVNGDFGMLRELIQNLCENAVRYNRPGGTVTVTVGNADGRVVLSVADTGIGIAKEDQARVFERFYRVDKSRSKETGGTGLGLSIVKHIVEFHSGEISLESEPGKGTVITILL